MPWELHPYPSIQVKQFVYLIRQYQGEFSVAELDNVLRHLFDNKIPAYAYIHARLNNLSKFSDYQSDVHPIGGYFKDMYQAVITFCQADNYHSVKLVAQEVMRLYQIIFPALIDWARDTEVSGSYLDAGKLPERKLRILSQLEYLPKSLKLTPSPKLSRWVRYEYLQQGHQLGNIWRTQWLLGIWNGNHCDLIPGEIWQQGLINFTSYQLKVEWSHVLPRLYQCNRKILDRYSNYLQCYYEKKFPPQLSSHASVVEIKAFIKKYEKRIFDKNFDTNEVSRCQKLLVQAFAYQGRQEQGKIFIKNFFLDEFGPLNSSSINVKPFMDYVVKRSTLFSQTEKCILLNRYVVFRNFDDDWIPHVFGDIEHVAKNLLPLIQDFFPLLVGKVLDVYQEKIPAYSIYSPQLLATLEFIHTHFQIQNKNVASYWLSKAIWKNPGKSCLNPLDYIRLYRLLDVSQAFSDWALYQSFGTQVLEKMVKISDYEEFHFASLSLLNINLGCSYTRIADEVLLHQIIKLTASRAIDFFGLDDGSLTYATQVQLWIANWHGKLPNQDYIFLLNEFMHGIQAQDYLCNWVISLSTTRDTPLLATVAISKLMNKIGENEQDRYRFLDFLCEEIRFKSLDSFAKYIRKSKKFFDIILKLHEYKEPSNEQITFWLRLTHQQFWSLSLEQRAVVIDSLICPLKSEASELTKEVAYEKNFKYIMNSLMGTQLNHRDRLAYSLIKTYLKESLPEEKQLLLAALISARKKSSTQSSLGSKLVILFEQMGPAYIKLAQAIHSYPDAPQDIRNDLSKMKSDATPPTRWQLLKLIREVLPENEYEQIKLVKGILGSASYHIAVLLLLNSGKERVLLLTRPDAQKLAQKGFAHIKRTLENCPDPLALKFRANMQDILSQAVRMSEYELNHEIGNLQHNFAQLIYRHPTETIIYRNQDYQLKIRASKSYQSGGQYRLLKNMEGTSFNKLPEETQEEKTFKKLVARAIVKFELRQILSGDVFDRDRHGEQVKINLKNNIIHIGLFDFGEMAVDAVTEKQREAVTNLLISLPKVMMKGSNFIAFIQAYIQKTADADAKNHLIRMQKALLALTDFLRVLEPEFQLIDIMKEILPHIHKDYQKALHQGQQDIGYKDKLTFFVRESISQVVNQFTPSNYFH